MESRPMNDWKRTFLQKLESAKKQWLHRFEHLAAEHLEPVFDEFAEFATNNGFQVSAPDCEAGTRRYKFALTENGYLLLTFQMKGLEKVEVDVEAFAPGHGGTELANRCTDLHQAGPSWVESQFQDGLDSFLTLFAEAGTAEAEHEEALLRA